MSLNDREQFSQRKGKILAWEKRLKHSFSKDQRLLLRHDEFNFRFSGRIIIDNKAFFQDAPFTYHVLLYESCFT